MSSRDCQGHEPSTFEPQGVTVYCDGSCRAPRVKDMDAVIRSHQALAAHDLKNHDPHGTGRAEHSFVIRGLK